MKTGPMNPGKSTKTTFFGTLRHDALASVVVFLVALPLCMAIAVASGAPPGAGLMTGIIGGLVVGVLAGCPLQVSGPAAGLTVVVWQYIQTFGMPALGIMVLLAGGIQILAAVLQLGQWFRAVSPAVIHGMLAGIGVLIFASQFHVMIDDTPKGTGIENILSLPSAIVKGLIPDDATATSHHLAARIGILTIIIIVLWEAVAPKKLRVIPALLVGIVLSTATATLLALPISYVEVRDNVFSVIQLPGPEHVAHLLDTSMWAAALGLAALASVETLLSATAVDHLHAGPRTRYNRELLSQGVGNMLCGVLGALPMTGVIVRSSANVRAGAKTRASTILHGAWLLLFVAFLPFILQLIPTASLAAVLVFTGYKLVHVEAIRELREHGRSEVLIYLGTLVMIVATNLLTGVLVGVGLAIAKLVYTTQNLETRLARHDDGPVTLQLMGIATFVSLPKLATALEQVTPGTEVHIDIQALRHIDHACLTLLDSWKTIHEVNGGRVILDRDRLQSLTPQTRESGRPLAPAPGVVTTEPDPARLDALARP